MKYTDKQYNFDIDKIYKSNAGFSFPAVESGGVVIERLGNRGEDTVLMAHQIELAPQLHAVKVDG